MARNYQGHLQRAHIQLETWASWEILNENCNVLGCQTSNIDGMPGSMPGKSIVPEVIRPPHISRVYWEVHDAPEEHRKIIYLKYIDGAKKLSERAVTRMLEYMAGRLR